MGLVIDSTVFVGAERGGRTVTGLLEELKQRAQGSDELRKTLEENLAEQQM